jgi:hypothetical protein
MERTFEEIIIYIPWFGDYHVHLDENGKPIRIYVYASDGQQPLPKGRGL